MKTHQSFEVFEKKTRSSNSLILIWFSKTQNWAFSSSEIYKTHIPGN
jgi:hypothetical protein